MPTRLRSTPILGLLLSLSLLAACASATPAAPTAVPEPTAAPTALPEPTAAPTALPEPTAAPTAVPEPTAAPTALPEPTAAPVMEGSANPFDVSLAQFYLDSAGFHGMAEELAANKAIESRYTTTVSRVSKVLKQTTWPADLNEQAAAFLSDLDAFGLALKDGKVDEAIELSEKVHDAQHELSHGIDEWAAANPASIGEATMFDVSVAQYLLDSAGFHGMAEELAANKAIESRYTTTVSRVSKVLKQTTWPADLNEQAAAFLSDLDAFGLALKDGKVDEAIDLSEKVHDAQHELSHGIDEWAATNPARTGVAAMFDVSVAQYLLDSAGFHDMAEELAANKAIESRYTTTVSRLSKVLKQTTWPADLNEQAAAFLSDLDAFGLALKDGKVDEAIELSEKVHDAQHELSHGIDGTPGGETHDH
ncbi:MAG: hypothetical protein Fur005_34650 [Roseiflexaceae bacterium]